MILNIMFETLISSKTRLKLLLKFFLNSQNTCYLRKLEEEFGESTNAIRIELNRFEKAGFLMSKMEGNRKMFTVNKEHPIFNDINSILKKMTGIEYVVDYVIKRIGDLERVYLVGNLSRGQDSDIIDLVLVGDNLNKVFLAEQIDKVEHTLNKKIRFLHFGAQEFDLENIKEKGMHPLLLWSK